MSEPSERPSLIRRILPITIKAGVSIALLVLLFERVDAATLWADVRRASVPWMLVATGIYFVNVLASTWRWWLLLNAQNVRLPRRMLLGSFLVAGFFNNFLPSNIGGDFIRIRDTAQHTRSKTLATTVILADRVLGLMGLVLVSAVGATVAGSLAGHAAAPIWPSWLWAGFFAALVATAPAIVAPVGFSRLLKPLTRLHPEWVGQRIEMLTTTLLRFRQRPGALAACFTGAVFVQALMVVYYFAVVKALRLPVSPWDLAVIVPLSFVVQMLPVSVNGFGVREATFSLYFAKIGLPIHGAVLLSLTATALIMLFSLSGAAVYVLRPKTTS